MFDQKTNEQMERIRKKVAKHAIERVVDFRKAWKLVYDEYKARTGINPWQGPAWATGMDNIALQGSLDDLEAIVDELIAPISTNQ